MPLRAITKSPQIAVALSEHPQAVVVLIAGNFDKRSEMTTGAMIEVSSEMMAVANEDKIGTAAAYQIGPVNIVNTLVTERGTDQSHLKAISNSGISIELV